MSGSLRREKKLESLNYLNLLPLAINNEFQCYAMCSLHVMASASSASRLHPQLGGAEEPRSQALPTYGTLALRSVTKGSSTFLLLHFLLPTQQITSFPVLGKPSQLLKHSQESFPVVKANIYISCALRGSGYDQLLRQDLAERDDLLKWINKAL